MGRSHAWDEVEVCRSEAPHSPLHLYADSASYWITAATLYHQPFLRGDDRKDHFAHALHSAAARWKVQLFAWTCLEDHWHGILSVEEARALPRFLNHLHASVARFVNEADRTPGRPVWRQYWDTFLNTEGDLWSRVNYIWWNPVRHGYCERPEDWAWTNLHALMSTDDDAVRGRLERFPAPRKLPHDLLGR